MPVYLETDYACQAKRLRAWTAHYIAKGCHPIKARNCAYRKRGTWPPKVKP